MIGDSGDAMQWDAALKFFAKMQAGREI